MKRLALILITLAATQLYVQAGELGQRMLWDGTIIPAAGWQTADGVTAELKDGAVVLRTKDVDYGWAAAEQMLPATANSLLNLSVKETHAGQLGVQLELVREDGNFIGAVSILQQAKGGASVSDKPLSKYFPEGEKPSKCRLKFWIEGRNAEVVISKASIVAPREWRKPGTKFVKAFTDTAAFNADPGIKVRADAGRLVAELEPNTGYSAFVLTDKVPYNRKGVALVDVLAIRGGTFTVQALCWNNEGTFLKSVDLIKDFNAAGLYEAALNTFEEQFPSDCTKLSFKIWLAGSNASARFGGLFYGTLP